RFTTGALSRITLFNSLLNDKSKELYSNYNNFIDANNPLSNNIAQAIELSYFIDRAEEITIDILENYKEEQRIKPSFKEGIGYSVTEAPRGLLAYMISVNEEGKVTKADIITPTAMFLAQKEIYD
ncbi:MAG: Ni/Fe hydrogenase subunit alpha, partial [Candidatus Heimdallarchaeaceae archaeon]